MLFSAPNPLLVLLIKPELCNMLPIECKKLKKYTKKGHFREKKSKQLIYKLKKSDLHKKSDFSVIF